MRENLTIPFTRAITPRPGDPLDRPQRRGFDDFGVSEDASRAGSNWSQGKAHALGPRWRAASTRARWTPTKSLPSVRTFVSLRRLYWSVQRGIAAFVAPEAISRALCAVLSYGGEIDEAEAVRRWPAGRRREPVLQLRIAHVTVCQQGSA